MRDKRKQLMILAALALCLLAAPRGSGAPGDGPGQRPYLGGSSWSLEATKAPGYGGMDWLTAAHVEAQSDGRTPGHSQNLDTRPLQPPGFISRALAGSESFTSHQL